MYFIQFVSFIIPTCRSSSTPPSGQQSSTPPTATSISPAPTNAQGSTSNATAASGQSLPGPQSQQQQQQVQTQQGQGQAPNSQQQQQMKAQLKAMKLTPSSKPQGIDPTVIIKEREHRYMCIFRSWNSIVCVLDTLPCQTGFFLA